MVEDLLVVVEDNFVDSWEVELEVVQKVELEAELVVPGEQVGEVELAEEELALIVEVGELLFIHLRYPFRTNFLTWMR